MSRKKLWSDLCVQTFSHLHTFGKLWNYVARYIHIKENLDASVRLWLTSGSFLDILETISNIPNFRLGKSGDFSKFQSTQLILCQIRRHITISIFLT